MRALGPLLTLAFCAAVASLSLGSKAVGSVQGSDRSAAFEARGIVLRPEVYPSATSAGHRSPWQAPLITVPEGVDAVLDRASLQPARTIRVNRGAPTTVFASPAPGRGPVGPSEGTLAVERSERARLTIDKAADEFGLTQDYPWRQRLHATAMCESGYRMDAVGAAGEIGIFQWLPSSWDANAAALGYGPDDIHDLVAQARMTAFALSKGEMWRWSCWNQSYDW